MKFEISVSLTLDETVLRQSGSITEIMIATIPNLSLTVHHTYIICCTVHKHGGLIIQIVKV